MATRTAPAPNNPAPIAAKAFEFEPVYAGDAAEMLTDSTATFGAGLTVEASTVGAGSAALAAGGGRVGATVVGAAVVGAAVDGGTNEGGTVAIGYCCAETGDEPKSATATNTEAKAPAGRNRKSERELMTVTIGVTKEDLQEKSHVECSFLPFTSA